MANITAQMDKLKDLSINGAKSRNVICNILDLINTEGANATSFQNHKAEDFVSKVELNTIMGAYLRRVGKVYNFRSCTDPDQRPINLTYSYSTTFPTNNLVTGNVQVPSREIVAGAFDVTLPTSNAVWQILGYGDQSELDDIISG